ncbi:MAG: hypothetical protein M0P57_13895 [Syntrophales bacterium]|jgi:protein-tyrosine phosphatase|nr:hypothetical protein [Syntrophales bacterium]MDY0044944.1 CpsB/CapC family capsule biosynthesis tyrosine phosphatase [Syntrophales bacterium]
MIDTHCHILPGIDDGPRDISESIAMCRMAESEGIRTIVATPHMLYDIYTFSNEDIRTKATLLNESLDRAAIGVTVLPGAEVAISPEIPELLRQGRLMTISDTGRHIILELTDIFPAEAVIDLVRQIRALNIIPIITHPERNPQIRKDPGYVKKLVTLDSLIQITGMSLTGDFGAAAKKTALTLLKEGLVHIIASDAHSAQWRPPLLAGAIAEAAKIVGFDAARAMVDEMPRRLIGEHKYSEFSGRHSLDAFASSGQYS